MRIALAAEGTRGDVHPLLALAERVRARGDEAVLCAPENFRDVARERDVAFRPIGRDTHAYLTETAGALTGGTLPMLRESDRYMRESMSIQFERMPDAIAGCDLVLAAGVQVGAVSAAELHGIPYRYVIYCPAILPSREYGPAFLPFQNLPRWGNALLWRLLIGVYDAVLGRLISRHRAALGLPPVRNVFPHLLGRHPLLAVDAGLATVPDDVPFDVEQIPCLHPFTNDPLPAKLEAFLDAGPPPVYLGFGSMTDPDPAETTEKLLACITHLGCRAVVSSGWAGLGAGPLPEGVFVTGPVNHARLFPRVAAVVHHGGAGTSTTAARAGVPQVIVPHVLDQFYWARRLRELGVAPPPLARRSLRPEPLAALLAEVVDNEWIAARARDLGAELRAQLAASGDPLDAVLDGC